MEQDSSVDYIQTSVDLDNDSSYNNATDNHDISTNIKTRKSSIGYDLPPKVNLYSENILQEEEASENIDRGSIADLGNIKQNWENRLVQIDKEKISTLKKSNKVVRHWSVKLNDSLGKPALNKKSVVPDSSYHNNQNMNSYMDTSDESESAIEREIRLSLEREESLKREQELRLLRLEKEKETSQVSIYQNNHNDCSPEHFQPTYLEMTEADRAHEIKKRENDLQLEPEVPKNYNRFSHTIATKKNINNNSDDKEFLKETENSEELRKTPMEYRETVVQAEIRLQKEKERQFAKASSSYNNNNTDRNDNNYNSDNYTIKIDSNDFDYAESSSCGSDKPVNEPPKEKYVSPLQVLPTSKIAQELQEIRQREAELKCMRQSLIETKITMDNEKTIKTVGNELMVEDNVTEASSLLCDSDKVNGNVENNTAAAEATTAKVNPNETPIEREIRLAQEREMQFRLDKGVPVEQKPSVVVSVDKMSHVSLKPKFSLKTNVDKGDKMKKIATCRLQAEIKKEVKREVSLRDSGRINTTSVDRIGEQKKYREVSPVTPKRNFTTIRKSSVASIESGSGDVDCLESSNLITTAKYGEPQKTNSPNFVIQKPKVSAIFSYREVKSNAGSLIEQELREMKEREDELKIQRKNSIPQASTTITDDNNVE